eukprot:scaffold6568_cov126-Isochrysis_galbana.AAC.7
MPHASNAGAWLARMSSACFHESAHLMTTLYDTYTYTLAILYLELENSTTPIYSLHHYLPFAICVRAARRPSQPCAAAWVRIAHSAVKA